MDIDLDKLRSFGDDLRQYVSAALIIKPETDSPNDVLNNGTFSHVDTGKVKLLVTAAHVYDYFKYLRTCEEGYKKYPYEDDLLETDQEPCFPDDTIEFAWAPAVGRVPIRLTESIPTGHDHQTIDLCTFECEVNPPLESLGKAWCKPSTWPPPRVVEGDQVIGVGFPGKDRRIVEQGEDKGLVMVATILSGQVTSVGPRHFVVSDEGMERQVFSIEGYESELSFGGMSGGMFFKFVEETSDKIVLQLVGFLYESYDIHGHGHEQHANFYVVHADFITETGLIDRALLF